MNNNNKSFQCLPYLIYYILFYIRSITNKKQIIDQWQEGDEAKALVMSYETFLSIVDPSRKIQIKGSYASYIDAKSELLFKTDIVVCDEGHNIRSSNSKLCQALSGIKTKRRIILTGSPIQNNLTEREY